MAETVEELLDRRQEAVEQAARYGQQLLEEKRELIEELERRQQECASLREQLDYQQLQHQKRNGELQRLSATQMEEMDTEISDLRAQMERTREEMLAERDKHRLIAENLHGEIAVLQNELQAERCAKARVVKKQEDSESKLKQRGQEAEKLREINTSLNSKLRAHTSEHKKLQEQVSIFTALCQNLQEELEEAQASCQCWQRLKVEEEDKVKELTEELNEAREMLEQLKLDQSLLQPSQGFLPLTPNSTTSGLSLMEEISLLAGNHSDSLFDSDEQQFPVTACHINLISPASSAGAPEAAEVQDGGFGSPSPVQKWTENCSRCSEMHDELELSKEELEQVNRQLMAVVKQKFKLQLELEKWENDMAVMVHRDVSRHSKGVRRSARAKKSTSHVILSSH